MWIETTRSTSEGKPLPRKLYCPEHDYRIEFTGTGRANVPEEVGVQVTSDYQTIEAVNNTEEKDKICQDE